MKQPSTEPLSTRRELELLRDLQRLANERAREEERIRRAGRRLASGRAGSRRGGRAEIEREFTEGRIASRRPNTRSVTGQARQRYEDRSQRGPEGI